MAEFLNVGDFFRQTVGEMGMMFENNTPGYSALKKATETKEFTEKGFRIPGWQRRPGGHTFTTPSASDFNASVAPQSFSMYVFPTGYALPISIQGPLLRALKMGGANAIISATDYIKLHTDTAMKRIEQLFPGDGTGALAYAGGTLSGTGAGQTLTCTTAAAATPGQTKGAKFLEQGHTYQAWNASTGAVRGTFTVTTPGTSTCVVNVTSGSITSGDPITDVGAYQKAMRGLGWLISDQSRTLQGLATASFPDLNSPFVDLNGALDTPATIETAKQQVKTRANDVNADGGLLCFTTGGRISNLRKQGYGLRRLQGDETVPGISKKYEDGDTTFVEMADMDEDRYYFVKPDQVKNFEEMPFGEYDLDGQDLRMVLGSNNTGSDVYVKAVGSRTNPGIVRPRACAGIKRATTSGITTQVVAG